ncbi:MAG: hypothetical protein OXC92_00995 [Flavobacteriaceae bacterium]|nr:hypothetical protein [Flavobacteriaceae bacterium]MCY4215546.1 hypothetical protein [Flavobacteriaceae bacterium]MCY4253326.1 hypothetical protein [Flavobacteriaceae bacterium]
MEDEVKFCGKILEIDKEDNFIHLSTKLNKNDDDLNKFRIKNQTEFLSFV